MGSLQAHGAVPDVGARLDLQEVGAPRTCHSGSIIELPDSLMTLEDKLVLVSDSSLHQREQGMCC